MKSDLNAPPKKTLDEILAHPKVTAAVNSLQKYMLDSQDNPSGTHFIHSLYVIGSFTNPEECNRYSDIDIVVLIPLSLFKENRDVYEHIKNILHDIEVNIQLKHPVEHDLHCWPKPIEWYKKDHLFIERSLLDFLRLAKDHEKWKKERQDYFSSSTPYDPLDLDGWSGLANEVLLQYEKATAILLAGEDIFTNLQLSETIHLDEWFELSLVASRDLAIGFAQRADGWDAIHRGEKDGDEFIQRGERKIAKAVLRMIYAEAITCGCHPLNSYKAIRDWALIRYAGDSRMCELADNAYRAKVLLERTLLCSTANMMHIAASNPEMTFVAPIANLFHNSIGMKKHIIYPREGFVQMPFKPGVREFYWERTIPNLIRCLAGRDINPMILDVFIPEIHDYVTRGMASIKQSASLEQIEKILDPELAGNAISILEHCIWFILTFRPDSFSRYDWYQMQGPFGRERVKQIDEDVENILYGEDQLLFDRFNKYGLGNLEGKTLETIKTLIIALAMYGNPATTIFEKELLRKGYLLSKKMISALGKKGEYQNSRQFYKSMRDAFLKFQGVKTRPFWKFW